MRSEWKEKRHRAAGIQALPQGNSHCRAPRKTKILNVTWPSKLQRTSQNRRLECILFINLLPWFRLFNYLIIWYLVLLSCKVLYSLISEIPFKKYFWGEKWKKKLSLSLPCHVLYHNDLRCHSSLLLRLVAMLCVHHPYSGNSFW